MPYKLQLTIFIIILIFIACGIISSLIIYHTSKYTSGKKLKAPFYRLTLAYIILGPIGLIAALGVYYYRERLGKCVEGNCFDGQGTKVYQNGDKYIGQWKKGEHNGAGTYHYADGSFEHGQWKDGELYKTEISIKKKRQITKDN